MIDGEILFVGIGDRTNMEAIAWLQEVIGTQFRVTPIHLLPGVLHLDCAFGPIARPNGKPGGALVYQEAFANQDDLGMLRKIYGRLFNLNSETYRKLGANTLGLNPETRIMIADCPEVEQILSKALGQRVIKIALDQLVLAEGAHRCATLPLLRE